MKKKLISMVMAAAMVVSLVPATAFAGDTGSAKAVAKVIDAADITKGADTDAMKNEKTELQLKVDGDGQYTGNGSTAKHELTFTLDGAEFVGTDNNKRKTNIEAMVSVDNTAGGGTAISGANLVVSDVDKDTFKLTLKGMLKDDAVITVKLGDKGGTTTGIKLKSTSVGKKATISVEGDMVTADDLVFAEVKDTGIKVTMKKVAEVAVDEATTMERELKIEANVGNFVSGQVFELKLNSGFEFGAINTSGTNWALVDTAYSTSSNTSEYKGETKAYIKATGAVDTITIPAEAIEIVTDDAKVGAEAKLTVKAIKDNATSGAFSDTADAVVVAKVVDDTVTLSVDEDEDVPVIYSGVNVANDGITDDSDHESLEVTFKETAKGALDVKKAFEMALPEGVYATEVKLTVEENGSASTPLSDEIIKTAYEKGEYDKFDFKKRVLSETQDDGFEYKLTFVLVAEPDFEGDVKLTLSGDAIDEEQEVTIAKFVKPYTVEASQNDLVIDYRNTKVPTDIVVKEAEEGLWAKDLSFTFDIDRFSDDAFENDATYTVDDKSGLELKEAKSGVGFTVDETSGDGAATVTISDVSLYMGRSLAAGAYDLELITNANVSLYAEELWTAETTDVTSVSGSFKTVTPLPSVYTVAEATDNDENHVISKGTIDATVVKEGYVNIVTAGRDQDDASFTTKVVVPVGESYLVAGETQVALDVPAFISAEGYTMLPVRAVATALGINNNNVLWNQATKTVTILYGQRIITMVAGQKVVTVNGNQIPASASVQIVNGRTFLPMRDLATALGVTDITWDAATKTATINGSK